MRVVDSVVYGSVILHFSLIAFLRLAPFIRASTGTLFSLLQMGLVLGGVMQNNKTETVGLWLTIVVGMAERFAFYGLRSVLVLFLISDADSVNPGLGWDREAAFSFNRSFLSVFAVSIIAAGVVIDTLLSVKRALLFGAISFAAGLLLIALAAFSRDLEDALYVGLGLAVAGSSLIRPAVYLALGDNAAGSESKLASVLYGYQWLAVSIAAMLAPLIIATVSDSNGWYVGLTICSVVALIAGGLVSRAKMFSGSRSLAETSADNATPIWCVVLIPVLLYLVAHSTSELLDDHIDAFFLTAGAVSVVGKEISAQWLQAGILVLGILLALVPLFVFRRRAEKFLPMMSLLTIGSCLYIVSAIMVAFSEYAGLQFSYAILLAAFVALLAELLLFVPMLTKIAIASGYRYRATAMSLILAFPAFMSYWFWPMIGELSSKVSWSFVFTGFVTILVAGAMFYRRRI